MEWRVAENQSIVFCILRTSSGTCTFPIVALQCARRAGHISWKVLNGVPTGTKDSQPQPYQQLTILFLRSGFGMDT